MSVGSLDSAMKAQTDLTQQMLGGQMKEVDQAMNTAKVAMQAGLKGQEMASQQQAVAALTGVGGNLNVTA